ncbi:MAG TPA: hypothetical protein VK475_11410 [Pyrinomonadaceae bacterium]|nr:hypothetical protein [Pyrinomonadaceae bacterium]
MQEQIKRGRTMSLILLASQTKIILIAVFLLLFVPTAAGAQTDDTWPSLEYLRSDYRSVRIVAHVRIREAKIVNQIPGYDNWKISAEVIEPFKGKFRKGEVIEYFHGAEAPSKKEFFSGEKLVFLLAEYDKAKKELRYYVLENSTLAPSPNRLKKLRAIRHSYTARRRH